MSRQERITAVFHAVFGAQIPTKLVPRLQRLSELAGAFVDACDAGEPKGNTVHAGIDWDTEPRLGKVPDGTLARLLGVSVATIRSARIARGIPIYYAGMELGQPSTPAVTSVKRSPGRPKGRQSVDWDAEPRLGQMSDLALSKELRVNRKSVQRARVKRGIAAHRDTLPETSEVSA